MLRYRYQETKEIKKLLVKLEALKILFEEIKPQPPFEDNLRRESLLKSALYSARVEGNLLDLEKISHASGEEKTTDLKKLEIFNLLRAYQYTYGPKSPKNLTLNFIKKLHHLAMDGVSSQAGEFRKEPWAIFNQAGVAIYLAPAPFRLPGLMKEFVQLDKKLDNEVPVKAAILQFLFEKIHPFADGNGRVGRLISAHIMKQGGYGFRDLVSSEEIIDQNRDDYYRALEPQQEADSFVKFFLESFVRQARLVLKRLNRRQGEFSEDFLLPRRREILEIIRDHPYCSFDFIFRRFLMVNPKTLHYDLKKLQEEGFIIKAGKTKGVTYKAK